MRYPVKFCLSAALLLAAGCIKSPQAPQPTGKDLSLPSFEDLLPGGFGSTSQTGSQTGSTGAIPGLSPSTTPTNGSLVANLSLQGLQLSPQELLQLQNMIQVQPSGRWSKSQDKTAEQNLVANYTRFGPMFTPSIDTADDYRLQAVTFAEKSTVPYYLDTDYYRNTRQLLVLKWSEDSGEFVMVQPDGTLANYLITHAIQPPRYVKIQF